MKTAGDGMMDQEENNMAKLLKKSGKKERKLTAYASCSCSCAACPPSNIPNYEELKGQLRGYEVGVEQAS